MSINNEVDYQPYHDKEYFALKPIEEIGHCIYKRLDDYYNFILTSNRISIWKRSYEFYNKGSVVGGRVTKAGQHGEYAMINVNHYRNLISHLLVLTTSQRPALECRATNTDSESNAQTKLGNGLLDYYMREKKVERYLKKAAEYALVFAEGYVMVEWDATSGEEYGVNPDTGAVIRQGDLKYTNFTPLDVARDFCKEDSSDHDWYITRRFHNKYNLAAQYPDLAEKILAVPSKTQDYKSMKLAYLVTTESDDIAVWTLWHRKCDAVPEGRMTVVVDADTVLFDGPLPYRNIPLFRMVQDDQIGSPFGYSVAWDLMPIQEAINSTYSAITTNISTFAVQNIAMPKGSNISVASLAGGLNLVEYDAKLGVPTPLNLTATPQEVYNYLSILERQMETLSGINSVARGTSDQSMKSGMSGAALALIQSMSIQFSSGLLLSYNELMEDVGTATIEILRDYAEVPRVAMIAGKTQKAYMAEFSGKDLSNINRVQVDVTNPVSKTSAGKLQIADQMLQAGMVETPDQYLQVLTTGKLEPLLEGKTMELHLIRQENEKMTDGEQMQAVITDHHALHIKEHRNVLSSIESRQNPQIVNAVVAHIQQHIELLKSSDPTLIQLIGEQPVAPTPPVNPNQPIGQGPGGPGSAPAMMDSTNPVMSEAGQVNMPNMPKNALTGNRFDPTTGGL